MDRETFDKLAAFNKFRLDAAEAEAVFSRCAQTVELLEPLRAADLGDAPIMVWADGVAPVYREDAREKTVSREEILALAPEQSEGSFTVPRVAD